MLIADLLSPLKRQFITCAVVALIVGGCTYFAFSLMPLTQKTTIYFSLKPVVSENISPTFDHAESTMKMAEAIAGWAKNPQFREDVAAEAKVNISNFKRKLAARKQNYINVFWTLKLTDSEIAHHQKIVEAIINQINSRFAALNKNSRAPYQMTAPEIFSENYKFPFWAILLVTLTLALGTGVLSAYLLEFVRGKASFMAQLETLFPKSAILNIPEKLGKHDEKLLEQFILTFQSPRLIGTFAASEKYFSLSPTESINHNSDTPVLLVKLGQTPFNELKNMKAIFGEKVGIIVFQQ